MTPPPTRRNARPAPPRRAFSLLELTLVLAILGLLSAMAVSRFGADALAVVDGEGLARQFVLDLRQARARTITTGVDHYVQINRDAGVVTGFVVCRSGGDPEESARTVPNGLAFSTSLDQWVFDFDGALTAAGGSTAATISGGDYVWTVTCYHPTGLVRSVKSAAP